MTLGLIPLLALLAILCCLASAIGRLPLWVAVLLLCLVLLLQVWR
jgi:hypothetical protein